MAKRIILAFGDSLTYGSNPVPGGERHALEDRWPTVLEAGLGAGAQVIAEGLGGRTTVHDDHFVDADRNGSRALPMLLASHGPLDLVIIMLGTNDLKPYLGRTALEASNGVRRLIRIVRGHAAAEGWSTPAMIIVAPPQIGETDHPEMLEHFGGDTAIEQSRRLAEMYRRRANEEGVGFFDASTVATPDPHDGVHLDAQNTRAIGEALVPLVKQVLGL